MCSISASRNKEELLKLVELNRYRGEESHSATQFKYQKGEGFQVRRQQKSYGPFDINLLEKDWDYCIVHQQAPTSKEVNNTDLATGRFIHPAQNEKSFLWHNGIIKEGKFEGDWDTEWLFDLTLDDLKKSPLKRFEAKISEADGTFACMMYHDNNIFVFRNEISPLFSKGSTFSSTKFEDSIPVQPNTMWRLDYDIAVLEEKWKFSTKENPYHFGE